MENEVFLQLQRIKGLDPSLEIYYWKDYQQNEVDFVLKKNKKIQQLIQVSFINSREEIRDREIKPLLKASRKLKCENLLFITWDYEAENKISNAKIKFIPLWKWLLI